jgi:hypothetical protein
MVHRPTPLCKLEDKTHHGHLRRLQELRKGDRLAFVHVGERAPARNDERGARVVKRAVVEADRRQINGIRDGLDEVQHRHIVVEGGRVVGGVDGHAGHGHAHCAIDAERRRPVVAVDLQAGQQAQHTRQTGRQADSTSRIPIASRQPGMWAGSVTGREGEIEGDRWIEISRGGTEREGGRERHIQGQRQTETYRDTDRLRDWVTAGRQGEHE